MSGLRRWSVAASIAASVMCVLPPVAGAVQLKCGDTVTEDVVLEADLKDCPRHGLTVGANGVTIDLNGHTIAGDGAEDIFADVIDTGVLDSGFDQVGIKKGPVRSSARTSCWSRSARAGSAWSTWPSRLSRSAARSRSRSSSRAWTRG